MARGPLLEPEDEEEDPRTEAEREADEEERDYTRAQDEASEADLRVERGY